MTVAETYENQAHYDITFLMFVWIAFLPTIIVPWIYASWVLSKPTKERLRGYLRLSSRRNTGTRSEQSLDEPGSTPPGQASKKALPLATPMPSIGPTANATNTVDNSGSSHRRSTSGRSGRGPILSADRLHLQADATATTSMMHDDSKSPASNSARTVETTISRQSSMAGRPRRQLPPPLRIEESNFHRTPSVQSGRTPSSGVNGAAHNSSIRSTASRVSSTAPLYRRYSRSQPQQPSMPDDDVGDDVSSLVGNSSDVTSSTYCVLPESAPHYANDPLSVAPGHRHLSGSSATYRRRSSAQTQASHLSAQSHATSASSVSRGRRGSAGTEDREATDELLADDDVSEIFSSVSQPSARKPVGILKATPSIASISESEYSSRKGSFSTLSRDLEIIDQLERERSMDIQEMIQREKSYEQYLVRQNSKLKFSTNFDEYFESAAVREAAAAAAAMASGGAGEGSPQPSHQGGSAQLPLQPIQSVGTVAQLPTPASRGGSLSPHSRARSPMHRRSSQLSGPPVSAGYAGEMGVGERQQAAFGPRRSIELERRFHRTYSTSGSTRSGSTRSRDRITFQDQV
ncbi:hypothetical protein ZHAS_00009721 [Anopheles sinensis]|uniref:Uncharacterized protein n=1 Tax=Anopheles sinensis TaxID=74873 RepID=A0A084VV82_ANOSI|nr:hypothetical protein ZHAS_00009721 [Anopheles sinensis]